MKAIKIILNFLYLVIFIYPTLSYPCNIEVKDLVVKSEVSEKFTNQKFLIKSGEKWFHISQDKECWICLLYTSPSPRDLSTSRMPSSA